MFELLDRCTEVLVMTSSAFDFSSPHIPANVTYVGPQLDDPDWATDWRLGGRDGDDPLVLVATSSVFQDQADLLRRVAAALGRLVPFGGWSRPGARWTPPTSRPRPTCASSEPLRTGPSSPRPPSSSRTPATAACSRRSRPGCQLVCMPMGRDQKDNTVRCSRLGAGVRVDKSAPPERIAAAVRQLLEDPAYAGAARRFADTLAEEGQTRPSAADRAETLLSSTTSRRSGDEGNRTLDLRRLFATPAPAVRRGRPGSVCPARR